MADSFDRYDNEGSGGGGFMMGLLTGTVLGAGLGMLLAPKAGAELRGALGEQARTWSNAASEQMKRAQDAAGTLAERGREMMDKARDAVSRGADEARNYASGTPGSGYSSGSSGSNYGGNTGSSYGSSGSGSFGSGSGGSSGGSDFGRS